MSRWSYPYVRTSSWRENTPHGCTERQGRQRQLGGYRSRALCWRGPSWRVARSALASAPALTPG
eukprot:scaffold70383_cov71-Phaeocystis_antarctica.AAC.1